LPAELAETGAVVEISGKRWQINLEMTIVDFLRELSSIPREERMRDPHYLREQARRCRALSKTAIEPEVSEQFRLWALGLADEADEVERQAVEREQTIVSV
jgi:hypothetical protein